MSDAIPLKIGETFQMTLPFSNDDGSPLDLSSYNVFAQVRDQLGSLVDTLGVTWFNDTPGVAFVSQATDGWPAGTLLCDIKLTAQGSGVATFSSTFTISCGPGMRVGGGGES